MPVKSPFFLLPLLALFLSASLVGCNNSDPYSDAKLSGDILQPSDVDPLDPDSTAATQIALFAGKPVKGLFYVCADNRSTRDYVHSISSTTTNSSGVSSTVVTPVPIALCGNDATSVTFYLGYKESTGSKKSVALGTVGLPVFTPTGSDGKSRYCNNSDACGDNYGGISNSKFLFNFSLADTQTAPARLDVNGVFNADPASTCKNSGSQNACQVIYLQALLQALDANRGLGAEVDIPAAVNTYLAETGAAITHLADLKFDYPSYAAFKSAWDPFVENACKDANGTPAVLCAGALPTDTGTLTTELANTVTQGSARLRAGNYSIDYSSQLAGYALYYNGAHPVLTEMVTKGAMNVSLLVYPDGRFAGIGKAIDTKQLCPNADLTTVDGINAYVMCIVFSTTRDHLLMATGDAGGVPLLSNALELKNLNLKSLSTGTPVAMQVKGQVMGNFMHDGRVPTNNVQGKVPDFKLDYPASNYVLKDSSKGSLLGSFFNITLPPYLTDDGSGTVTVGTNPNPVNGGDPWPFPVRMNQTNVFQTTPLDQAVLDQIMAATPAWYRLQLMRFCAGTEVGSAECSLIPASEIGDDPSFNYPTKVLSTNTAITQEKPSANTLNGVVSNVNLRFVDIGQPGARSLVLELLKDDCSGPVLDAQNQPIRVGYVMATPPGSGTPSVASADITVLFAAPDVASVGKMPHLGVGLAGRINLNDVTATDGTPVWPLYRLGDTGFAGGVRAHWSDDSLYQVTDYIQWLRTPGNVSPTPAKLDDLTADQQDMANALSAGAVVGQRLDASCQPAT